MKQLKDNKGAAMVSVLVAVTFIAILSSSLLYMAYMNYLTKSMRLQGADTFYTDEYALDDLSTSLQQVAADQPDIATARIKLREACGVAPAAVHKTYDGSVVAQNIKFATKDPHIKEVIVDTTWDTSVSDNYIEEGNKVKLGGLKITTTTDKGFTSTIITDLTIYFPSSGSGDMDINSFSIIADNTIHAKAGILTLTGNIFCKAPECNQLNPGGHDALIVEPTAVCTLLSPRGIIYGDVRIKGTGAMTIAGQVGVTGDIYVDSNAVLFISGKLTIKGEIKGSGKVIGEDNVIEKPDMDVSQLPDDGTGSSTGITSELFTNVYLWNGSSFVSVNGADLIKTFPNTGNTGAKYDSNLTSTTTGHKYSASTINAGTTINGLDSCLLMTTATFDIQGGGDLYESTILTTKDVSSPIDAVSTHMSKLPNDGYEASKGVLIQKNGSGNDGAVPIPSSYLKFHGGNNTDSAYIDALGTGADYGKNHGSFKVKAYTDDKTLDSGSTGTEPRYAIFNTATGEQYIPYGYLLRADSASYISNIMNSILGESNPKNTSAAYDNWYKE